MTDWHDFNFARDSSEEDAARWNSQLLTIGHAGAGALAPKNTLKGLRLALDLGVDMVEFDVRPCRDALVLAHENDLSHSGIAGGYLADYALQELQTLDVGEGERIPSLREALDLIGGRALMNVDVKAAGYERELFDTLREKGVVGDVLFSSVIPASLRAIRQMAPEARTGISYPADHGHASEHRFLQPEIRVIIKAMRLALPHRILGMMASAQANAAMLNQFVVSPEVLEKVHAAQGRVFVWTVDELSHLEEIQALGVDGIASNRPDLFASLV